MPVTDPAEPTVALALDELQVPPGVASVNVMETPVQTDDAPPIMDGTAFTVTGAVTKSVQPEPVVTR